MPAAAAPMVTIAITPRPGSAIGAKPYEDISVFVSIVIELPQPTKRKRATPKTNAGSMIQRSATGPHFNGGPIAGSVKDAASRRGRLPL